MKLLSLLGLTTAAATAEILLPSTVPGSVILPESEKITSFAQADICPERCTWSDNRGYYCYVNEEKKCMEKMAIVPTERVRDLLDDVQRCNAKVRSLEEKVKMRDAEKMYIREGRDQCRADARERAQKGEAVTVTVTFGAPAQPASTVMVYF